MEYHRLFFCGLGRRFKSHFKAINQQNRVEITGGYDPSPAAREEAMRFGLANASADLNVIAKTHSDCVVLCTPPQIRLSLIKEITQFSCVKAIIIEKPLAVSILEAEEIYRICESKHISLTVVHQLRYAEEFKSLKATVTSGRLGHIDFIYGACYGNIFDQGSHMTDLLGWLTENQPVHWVDASACDDLVNLAHCHPIPADFTKDTVHPGHASTSIRLRFASGIEAMLSCGVLEKVVKPELGPWLQKRITVVGSNGMATAHVASHFLEISKDEQKSIRTNIREYEACLPAFYEAFFNSYDRKLSLQQKEENLNTLKVMEAARLSGTLHQIIALDKISNFTSQEKVLIPNEAQDAPLVSVIIPMEDHRGWGEKAIKSWTTGQRGDPNDFELIILIDKSTQALEPQFRRLLRTQDRLVYADALNEMEQYHQGAMLAKGTYLFFTEPHCLAESEAMIETIKFYKTESHDGFCSRSTSICINKTAEMESKMYDDGFINWSKPSAWEKAIIRGFSIKKQVYMDVGGFHFQYDRFSEWLLAAEIRKRGYSLSYAPGVGLAHAYSDTLSLLDRFIKEFTDGECKYRLETKDQEFCFHFFGAPVEWNEVRMFRPELARKIIYQTLLLFFKQKRTNEYQREYRIILRQLFTQLPKAILGKKALLLKYYSNVILAKLNFWLSSNDEKKYKAFVNYYMKETELCRAKYGLSAPYPADVKTEDTFHYTLAKINENNIYGFHPEEIHQGNPFRWSSTNSALKLQVKPDNYLVKIYVQHVKKNILNQEIAIFLNDKLIENVMVEDNSTTISFQLQSAWFKHLNWLFIYSLPFLHASGDDRSLGLPIREIKLYRDATAIL